MTGKSSNCSFGGCYKQEIYQKYAAEKGEGIMRIAVTYEKNGQIFQHFGHTETFKIYDVEEGKSSTSRSSGYKMEADMVHWREFLVHWMQMFWSVAESEAVHRQR